jgi:hypothetical protein
MHLLSLITFSCLLHLSHCVFLPQIFRDGVVLQTPADGGPPARIFGYANAAEAVAINMTISGVLTQYNTVADAVTGKWSVTVIPSGTDLTPRDVSFSVAAESDITPTTFGNASFGEVILCNGQSNMVLSVAAASNPIGRASPPSPPLQNTTFPDIRLFSVISTNSSVPTRDLPLYINRTQTRCSWGNVENVTQKLVCQTWQVAEPGVTDFISAECFYTAHSLITSGAIPAGRIVALIQSAYSGTAMELWVPEQALDGCPKSAVAAASNLVLTDVETTTLAAPPWIPGCLGPWTTSCLWNDMIYPIVGFSVRAVLHNQIESNMGDSFEYYSCVFQNMIATWRQLWDAPLLPWLTTGLGDQGFSPDNGGKNVGFPTYVATPRDAQASILSGRYPGVSRTLNGGLVSAYDLGDRVGNPNGVWDVHSRFKAEVGRRMALVFRNVTGLGVPSGGSVDWDGPVAGPATSSVDGIISFVWSASSLVYSNWTQDSWEGCDGAVAQDTFQVSTAYAGPNFTKYTSWSNTTFTFDAPTKKITLTPVKPASPGNPYLVVRYAASLWPQCAFYSSSNDVPARAFSDLNVTVGSTSL